MKAECCMNCRFANSPPGAGFACRRYPPSVTSPQPTVRADGWCGEWQSMEPKRKGKGAVTEG